MKKPDFCMQITSSNIFCRGNVCILDVQKFGWFETSQMINCLRNFHIFSSLINQKEKILDTWKLIKLNFQSLNITSWKVVCPSLETSREFKLFSLHKLAAFLRYYLSDLKIANCSQFNYKKSTKIFEIIRMWSACKTYVFFQTNRQALER